MTLIIAIVVGVIFTSATFLMLGRELKGVCMGVFLLGHGANLAILAGSRSPVGKLPPVLAYDTPLDQFVDPLPQALILTAIVIGFAVQAFLLTLLVLIWRKNNTLQLAELAVDDHH
jgi:multicomponent Na+:H+ antiporter subunit C